MSGHSPGQGGGAAKTHKEPPSQLLNIDKLIFAALNTETLKVLLIQKQLHWAISEEKYSAPVLKHFSLVCVC